LFVVFSVYTVFACEMVAIRGMNNTNLVSGTTNIPAQNTDVKNLFSYFKHLGYHSNDNTTQDRNGFGVVYYLNNDANTTPGIINPSPSYFMTSDRRYATYKANASQDSDIYYSVTDTTISVVFQYSSLAGSQAKKYKDIRIVLAHKRKATSGPTNIADPHPFVYRSDGRSYSFMHNGTINNRYDDPDLPRMKAYYNANPYYQDAEMQAIYNLGVDSGYFFVYLLMHIKQQDMNVFEGLRAALIPLVNTELHQYNFVLTDGYDIYAYRDTNEGHPLYLYFRADRNLAMVTTSNAPTNESNSSLGQVFNNSHRTILSNKSLAVIPVHGMPYIFENFGGTGPVTLNRWVKNGVNWHSFPVLPYTAHNIVELLGDLQFPNAPYIGSTFISTKGGAGSKNLSTGIWTFSPTQPPATAALGTKITYPEVAKFISLSGNILDLPSFGTFLAGETYWVTYNLMSSQSLYHALGEHYSKIYQVQAENWTHTRLYDIHPLRNGAKLVLTNNSNRPMEYGKTYIITLDNDADPILNFQWSDSRQPASGRLLSQAQFFKYTQKEDYEAIDIVDVSDNPEACLEIGAFVDEVCIGATKIDEFPTQVLLYTQGYEGLPLTFRALYHSGVVSQIDPVVEVYDAKRADYKKTVLVAGSIGHSVAKLNNNKDYSEVAIPAMVAKHTVYPNPFNPTTTINFSITARSNVNIVVYNIKGQSVATLFNGELPEGNHFIQFDGKDKNNATLASGVYFYRISTSFNTATGKMLLIK